MVENYKRLLNLSEVLWKYIAVVVTRVDYNEKYVRKGGVKEWKRVLGEKEAGIRRELNEMMCICNNARDVTVIAIGSLDFPDGHFYWKGHPARTEIISRLGLIKSFVKRNIERGAGMMISPGNVSCAPTLGHGLRTLRQNFQKDVRSFASFQFNSINWNVPYSPDVLWNFEAKEVMQSHLPKWNEKTKREGKILVAKHMQMF